MSDEGDSTNQAEIDNRIREMREEGVPWNKIQEVFGLSRQQARYCYQRGKRVQRRAARRDPDRKVR